MNEELAALERALRRAAKERAEREAALETLRTDLEDSMVATAEAETRLEVERAARQDITRRLLSEQVRTLQIRLDCNDQRQTLQSVAADARLPARRHPPAHRR